MNNSDNISHITIIAASIEKMYNKSRVNGRLHTRDIYLLEAINKFLSACVSSLNHDQKQRLFALYNDTIATSKDICRLINITPSIIQKKSSFTQNNENSSNVLPGPYNSIFNNIFE